MSAITELVGIIVRATRAKRVLEIGSGAGASGLAIAESMPHDGLLITLERDAAAAAMARLAFAAAGHDRKATVLVGDACRYLYKLAGPFDVIVQDSEVTQYETMHQRLVRLLSPSATMIVTGMNRAGRYNEVLTTDARLSTVLLNVGDGLAISVRRGPDDDTTGETGS